MENSSIFLRSFNGFLNKLENGYGSSYLFKFFFLLMHKLEEYYDNSALARFVRGIGAFLKAIASSSRICSFICKSGDSTKLMEGSIAYSITCRVSNAPTVLLRKLYTRYEYVLASSYIFVLIKHLLRRLDILIGAALILILSVPHQYWFNGYTTIIAVGLAFTFFIRTIIRKHESFNIKSIDIGLFVFIITIILGEVTSIYPVASVNFFIFYFTCFLFVLVITSAVRTTQGLNRLVEIMLYGIAITGVYGVWQSIIGVPFDPALTDITLNEGMPGRIYSTMQNPNSYAEVLVLTLPFFAAVILNSRSFVKKLFFAVLILPPLLSLLATGSRSAWISVAISVLVFTFLKNRKLIPLMALMGIVGFFLLPYISEPTYRRIMTLFMQDTSIGYRGRILETVKPMFEDFWFTGVGLGPTTFMEVCQQYFLFTGTVTPPHTHNLFLQVWIEGGLISILAFLWFIIRIVKKSFAGIFGKLNTSVGNMLIAGISALAGITVMGMAEYVWFYPRVMLMFWIVIGIILAGLSILAAKSGIYNEE